MIKHKITAALVFALCTAGSSVHASDAAETSSVPAFNVNEDYREITAEPAVAKEISEFFSFWCFHCKDFNGRMLDIKKALSGEMPVKLYPVSFGDEASRWAQLGFFYAQKHQSEVPYLNLMFSLIHEQRVDIKDKEKVAAVINLIGLDDNDFLQHAEDPEYTEQSAAVDRMITHYEINAVPELVVNGKYIPAIYKFNTVEEQTELLRYIANLPASGS